MATVHREESYHLESFECAFQKVKAQVTTDLATCATMLQRLLMAVDLFPLGGLYQGHYAEQAICRYWLLWMPLLHNTQQQSGDTAKSLIPPLDIQWAWFVHRLNPQKYMRDCIARFGAGLHPANVQQALGFSSGCSGSGSIGGSSQRQQQPERQQRQARGDSSRDDAVEDDLTRRIWNASYPTGLCQPPEHVFWPPAPRSAYRGKCHQPGCAHLCRRLENSNHPNHQHHHQHEQQQLPSQPQPQPQPQSAPDVRPPSSSSSSPSSSCPSKDSSPPEISAVAACKATESSLTPAGQAHGDGACGGGGGGDGGGGGGGFNGNGATTIGDSPSPLPSPPSSPLSPPPSAPPPPPPPPPPASSHLDDGSLKSVRSYVRDAMIRQGRFAHQVLRYFYQDPDFLEAGRIRYLHFLTLIRTQPPGASALNPMYDQDLIWHSHMALSGTYVADCEVIMPADRRPLRHDDSMNEDSLVDSFAFTLRCYEDITGLMVNPSPTRRVPTFIAQPLVARLWPLAAALTDPRVTELPPPRKIATELRTDPWGFNQQQQQRQQEKPGKNGSGAPTAASRTGVFAGDPNPPHGGDSNRPPMLGSPDHLRRCGSFAIFALWHLAERLQLPGGLAASRRWDQRHTPLSAGSNDEDNDSGGEGGNEKDTNKAQQLQPQQPQPIGSSSTSLSALCSCSELQRATGVLMMRPCLPLGLMSPSFPTTAREGRYGNGVMDEEVLIDEAEVDDAIRYMTDQLLRLRDLTLPDSPLNSHRHPFWSDITPLPSHQNHNHNQQPQSPASASPSHCHNHHHHHHRHRGRRPRHLAPAPRVDLPCSYLSPASRSKEFAYLAPDQYAVSGQVCYTPSDFCLLGHGRWCLPGALAAEVLGPRYDSHIDETDHVGNRCRYYIPKQERRRQWWCWRRSSRYGIDEYDDGNLGLRIYGNTLGSIVFSLRWSDHIAKSYRRIYQELRRRTSSSSSLSP